MSYVLSVTEAWGSKQDKKEEKMPFVTAIVWTLRTEM